MKQNFRLLYLTLFVMLLLSSCGAYSEPTQEEIANYQADFPNTIFIENLEPVIMFNRAFGEQYYTGRIYELENTVGEHCTILVFFGETSISCTPKP